MRILGVTGRLCTRRGVVGIPIDYTCSNSTPFRLGPLGGVVRSCGKENREFSEDSSSVRLRLQGVRGGRLWVLCQRQCRLRSVEVPEYPHTLSRGFRRGLGGGCHFAEPNASDHTAIVGRVAYFRATPPIFPIG
jgi:hypothetical protein